MTNDELDKYIKERITHVFQAYKDIRQLYNLTESDTVVMTQMLHALVGLGISPTLVTKLLKPLSTLMEMITEDKKETK